MPDRKQANLGRRKMELAFEINLALWIMMGCVAIEASHVVQYLG